MTTSARQLNDHDRELLSSYIDDALTIGEREALEKRLAREPDLRVELDELRVLVQALRALPTVPPPRSFTIDLAAEARARPWWMSMRGMFGATGAIAALFVLAWVSISMLNSLPSATFTAAMAPTSAAALSEAAPPETLSNENQPVQSYDPAAPAATVAPAEIAAGSAAATVVPAATAAPAAIAAAPAATEAPAATTAPAAEAPPAMAMAPPVTMAPGMTETTFTERSSEDSAAATGGAASTDQATAEAVTPAALAQEATELPTAKEQGNSADTSAQRQASNPEPFPTTVVLGIVLIVLAVFLAVFVMRRRA